MKTFFLMIAATAILIAADTSLMGQTPTPTATPSPTPMATPTPGPSGVSKQSDKLENAKASKADRKKSHQRRAEGGPTYEPAATPKPSEEQE
jgi:hypothetical protein